MALKGKHLTLLTLTLFVLFVLSLTVLSKAQTTSTVWSDNMKYSSVDQMQSAGWKANDPAGVNFTSSGVVLVASSITFSGSFPSNFSDWQVEDQGCWVSGVNGENNVGAITESGSYEFAADGWYSQFILYVNSQIVWRSTQGTFQESQNTLLNLTMTKFGDKINCYYNGELEYTYNTHDSSPFVSVSAVSPWDGSTEYDYFAVSSVVGSGSSGSGSSTILSNPVAVGGIAGGVAVGVGAGVGLAIHFGVIGGGAAGSASAGSGAAATGSTGSASASAGSGSGAAGSSSGGGSSGSGGGDASDSNLVADAGNIQQMQQANVDAQQATQIQNQMQQANQNQANQLQQTQQDTQTKITQTQQDVTSNKQKAQDKANQSCDQYIKQASTDSDSSVAQESSGSAESGEG